MKMHVAVLVVTFILLPGCAKKPQGTAGKEPAQYTIAQFYKNKQISGGTFSPDETRLLVSSNESGISNLYQIAIADSHQTPVTKSTVESFYAIDYVPGTTQMLYTADKGGNEINHIYLLDEGGALKDLTPAVNEKATFLGWSLDKKSFYYLSNKRDPKFFDLCKMSVATWKPSIMYRNDAGYDVGDVSWDEKYLTLSQNITTSVDRLYLYDVSSKTMKEISDPAKPGYYSSTGFTKDNKSLVYITDADRQFRYLVQYDVSTGKRKTVFESEWDVMYSYDSDHEHYRVIGINADGKNVLKIFNLKTEQEVHFPDIQDGDVVSVSISPSEKLMRLTIGSSKAPDNIYVYNFDSGELRRMTNTLNSELNPADLVSAKVVRFRSFDSLEIPAIYYKPLAASPARKVPALIWVHGGPGDQSRVGYFALIQFLVNHGYAILAVNNRGSSGYGKTFYTLDDRNHGDRDLRDCIAGKKYLQAFDDIDPGKIGILGGSYGGFMTMAAMTFHPDEFKVGVDLFGVTNWVRTLKSVPPYWESFRKALYAEMGDPFTADSVRLLAISPLFHASSIKHPVMVLQGFNDPRVLKAESDEIVDAMKKNNVSVEYVLFPDEGHGFRKKENQIKGYGEILTFLDKYLREEVSQ